MSQRVRCHNQIPVLADVDLIVVGVGSAGCCAAIAGAEHGGVRGLRVGLIERYGFLGGSSTQALDTFFGFLTLGRPPKTADQAAPAAWSRRSPAGVSP